MKDGIIFWANLQTKKESFSYKRKLRKLWQRINPEFHVNLHQSIGNTDSTFSIHTIIMIFSAHNLKYFTFNFRSTYEARCNNI